jgi:long-chain acyl-CoA synthetase
MQNSRYPGYARIPRVAVLEAPWTVENGVMTPTLKLRREKILECRQSEIDWLYAGH